jgi:hypothetical protein
VRDIIFVSCGQRTADEIALGKAICSLIRENTSYEPYFAEFQSNLSGLNDNIMGALSRAVGLITVLHSRGVIHDAGNTTRASVWIEQEIAIAAYIEKTTSRELLTVAYIQAGVALEGIRTLLHLNPKQFTTNDEILEDLKQKASLWPKSSLPEFGERIISDEKGTLKLLVARSNSVPGLPVASLTPQFMNTGARVKEYSCAIEIPTPLLNFQSASFMIETTSIRPGYRKFRMTEQNRSGVPIQRDEMVDLMIIEIARMNLGNTDRDKVSSQPIFVTAEMDDRLYRVSMIVDSIFALIES